MKKNEYIEESLIILDSYYLELNYYKKQLNIIKRYRIFRNESYYKKVYELENKIKECQNKIKNYIDD